MQYDYIYTCPNSLQIIDELKGKEKKLLKRLYVEIDDCPEYMIPEVQYYREQVIRLSRQHFLVRLFYKIK